MKDELSERMCESFLAISKLKKLLILAFSFQGEFNHGHEVNLQPQEKLFLPANQRRGSTGEPLLRYGPPMQW